MTFRQVLLYQTKLTYSNILICISILLYCTFFPFLLYPVHNGRIFKITVTHREACQKEGFYLRPIFFSFCTIRCRFLLWLFLEKNVVGAASDNFIYDLEKTSFSFEYYYSKSSHSIEGRFQVAWIIDLQKWLFSLIMHEHILFTFNRKNTDSRPYHWRKGLCIYTKTVVTYVLTKNHALF